MGAISLTYFAFRSRAQPMLVLHSAAKSSGSNQSEDITWAIRNGAGKFASMDSASASIAAQSLKKFVESKRTFWHANKSPGNCARRNTGEFASPAPCINNRQPGQT